jgi:hypothetical protein
MAWTPTRSSAAAAIPPHDIVLFLFYIFAWINKPTQQQQQHQNGPIRNIQQNYEATSRFIFKDMRPRPADSAAHSVRLDPKQG